MNYIQYKVQSKEWGTVTICQIIPNKDGSWGSFEVLRGTDLEPFLPVVSGEALSHAKHGWIMPFIREVGPSPKEVISKLQGEGWPCAYKTDNSCGFPQPICRPDKKSPVCYEPGLPVEARVVGAFVIRSWTEGAYVCILTGVEHNLK